MPRRATWKDLLIGLLAAGVIAGGALAILIFGRVGRLHGKTITIYATTDAARGLIPGSEVWLDGQKIGLVRSIAFRPPDSAQRERLVIKMAILQDALPNLRADTRVTVRTGANLIGDQVVYLSSGSAKLRGMASGDTIHGGQQTDVEEMSSDIALASREFPALIENVKLLSRQLEATEAALGALGVEPGGGNLASVRLRTGRLMNRITSQTGTLGQGMHAVGDLQRRATAAMTQFDSIQALVGSNALSLGRFRRDTSLMIQLGQIRSALADAQRLAESPNGTIGRARTDSVIVRNVHRDLAAVDSLIADMKKHPLRYIAF